jgi:hypothetical protein
MAEYNLLTGQVTEERKLDMSVRTLASLSSHINHCFEEAETAKQVVLERLMKCQRQRKGEYEPQLKAQIDAIGGQQIFMMLTDIKCRAADSWIKDVMLNHEDSTWGLQNTAEPLLPPELNEEVVAAVMQEAAEVAAGGMPVNPEALPMRHEQIVDEAYQAALVEADKRRERMERRIADKMQEGGWKNAMNEVIYDFTTYPAAFMKGPILRRKKKMVWGPQMQPVVKEEVVLEYERVSPFDIFPSPSAVSIQDGYLIQRHRLTRVQLRQMSRMAGADPEAIEEVLRVYKSGYRTMRPGDTEHDQLNGRNIAFGPDGLIEALEYWGPASGAMLREWGLESHNGMKIDEDEEYQINAWKVGTHVVRAVINPDPLDQRPYGKACFEDIPGAFWGTALPEMMADVQTVCNAAARALAMNMGLASGPMVEVTVDRFAPGENVTNLYPWRQFQMTSDRTGGGQPAIRFYQPNMHANELLQIYTYFSKIADETTGVPNYIYGSSNVSGAGRTASGLSMLMENASKGIKHAILNLDEAATSCVERTYVHLMLHDPDTSIKGDMQIIPAGAIGAMIKERQTEARQQFMAATANQFDMQIIGVEGRAYQLRETAKGLFPDLNKAVPDIETLRRKMAAEQEMAAQQQMAAQEQMAMGQGGMPPEGAQPTPV